MFECLVFIEDGEVFCVDDKIYPETKLVKKVRMVTETGSIEDANACIDQLLDQYFAVYGNPEFAKEYPDYHDVFYRRAHSVYNNDSWVLCGCIPELNDNYGFCGRSPDTTYTRHGYKRFYWIMKNAGQNYLPAQVYQYKEPAAETCPLMKGGETNGHQTAD